MAKEEKKIEEAFSLMISFSKSSFDGLNQISGIRSCKSHYVFLAIKEGVRREVPLTTTQSQDGYASQST